LSALRRQGLDRRLADRPTVERAAARVSACNAAGAAIDWPFTTEDARTKRKRLSPASHA
jgi:hypothetical protein